MKRSPLLRRTPLARGTTLRSWNSSIPSKSAKRVREDRQRTKVLRELKALYPICQRCGVRPSSEGHEPLTRARLGSITDKNNIVMLCAPNGCHRWIHDHPAQATKEGYLVSRYA